MQSLEVVECFEPLHACFDFRFPAAAKQAGACEPNNVFGLFASIRNVEIAFDRLVCPSCPFCGQSVPVVDRFVLEHSKWCNELPSVVAFATTRNPIVVRCEYFHLLYQSCVHLYFQLLPLLLLCDHVILSDFHQNCASLIFHVTNWITNQSSSSHTSSLKLPNLFTLKAHDLNENMCFCTWF